MKKNFHIIMMLLVCGAMIFTGCKKDDDTSSGGGGTGGGPTTTNIMTIGNKSWDISKASGYRETYHNYNNPQPHYRLSFKAGVNTIKVCFSSWELLAGAYDLSISSDIEETRIIVNGVKSLAKSGKLTVLQQGENYYTIDMEGLTDNNVSFSIHYEGGLHSENPYVGSGTLKINSNSSYNIHWGGVEDGKLVFDCNYQGGEGSWFFTFNFGTQGFNTGNYVIPEDVSGYLHTDSYNMGWGSSSQSGNLSITKSGDIYTISASGLHCNGNEEYSIPDMDISIEFSGNLGLIE